MLFIALALGSQIVGKIEMLAERQGMAGILGGALVIIDTCQKVIRICDKNRRYPDWRVMKQAPKHLRRQLLTSCMQHLSRN